MLKQRATQVPLGIGFINVRYRLCIRLWAHDPSPRTQRAKPSEFSVHELWGGDMTGEVQGTILVSNILIFLQ